MADASTLDAQRTAPAVETIPLLMDDVSSIPTWSPPRRERLVRLLVLLTAILIFLPNLGGFGLWDPWETHYGEVTRNMIETYDWVSPWWGFKEQIGTERINGDWFFSKPIFIFWAEATSVKIFGLSDWAVRLPIALLAIAAVFGLYLTFSRLLDRKTGLLVALVTATAPQFFLIARQAQTDMPFVATMILAMCAFVLGVWGPREKVTNRQFWWRTALMVGFVLAATVPQFMVIATDLSKEVPANLPWGVRLLQTFQGNGVYHVIIYGIVTAAILAAVLVPVFRRWRREHTFDDTFKDRTLRRYYILTFYVLLGASTLAKGLLGFLLPGFIIGAFLFLTRPKLALQLLVMLLFPPISWLVLRKDERFRKAMRFEPILGFSLMLVVMLPWYLAMFARFGMAYYTRFFIHDHFNRLEAGVHQIDSGTFEHFLKWLGFGIFPWIAFVPLVIVQAVRTRLSGGSVRNQLRLLLFLWFFLSYVLFTLAATKFHHYIFPALPPMAVLIAWALRDTLKDRSRLLRGAALLAIGLHIAVSWNIHAEPQQLRNLMTYKYDRPLPKHLPIDTEATVSPTSHEVWADSVFFKHTTPFVQALLLNPLLEYGGFILFVGAFGLVGLLLFFFVRTRGPGVIVVGLSGAFLALWSLNYYMPMLSPHWSQKYLFEAYYDDCTRIENPAPIDEAYTPIILSMGLDGLFDSVGANKKRVCREDIVSWLLTWRGETYYSYNEIQPINTEATQFEAYLSERNRGKVFYLFMERGKTGAMQTKLNTYTKRLQGKKTREFMGIDSWVVETVHDENQYFILAKATPQRVKKTAEEPAR